VIGTAASRPESAASALSPGHGNLRRLPSPAARQFLARLRHWIDTRTDQVIIIVSLILGFWLVRNSSSYIVT
jgi:hypothetical protein